MINIVSFLKNRLLVVLLLCPLSLLAQKTTVINVGTDESLVNKMTDDEWANTTKLILTTSGTGKITAVDFSTLINKMPKLGELDMAGDMNSTSFGPLNDNKTVKTVLLPPKTVSISSCSNSALEGVIEFPKTVAGYGEIENKFLNCQSITGFSFPEGHATLSTNESGTILFASFTTTQGVTGKRLSLYLSCNKGMSYTMPEDVVAIGLSAFGYNNYLTELTFSSKLTDMLRQNGNVRADVIAPQTLNLRAIHVPSSNPDFASTENGFLVDKTTSALILVPPANKDTHIVIDGGYVKKIGGNLFSNFPHIKTVIFGEGIEEIGGGAFKQGSNGPMELEFVSMPSTLKKIGGEAFALCDKMKQYICEATTPPVIDGNAVFRLANASDKVMVGVPASSVAAYLASDWLDENYKSYLQGGERGNAKNGWSFQTAQIVGYKTITYKNATGIFDLCVPGALMQVTAGDAPGGEAFSGWISEPAGVVFDNPNVSPAYFTMPDNDVTITATYAGAKPYTILDAITPSGFAAIGGTVSIKAAPTKGADNNEIFQGWEIIEGVGVVINDPDAAETFFTMIDGVVTIKAVYKSSYLLNVRGGSATSSEGSALDAFAGETITVSAVKRPNQAFEKWSSSTPNVVFADETATVTTFVMPDSDVDVQADFVTTPETGSGFGIPGGIYPNDCFNGDLTDYQTSWIANDGGVPRTHVPHSMDAIFVRGDGTVATICNWDEGGTNVGIWKDGKIISIPVESGTGSWGRNSGKAVAMDDQYVYQLMRFNGNSGNDNLNSNGLRMYPPKGSGIEWQLITRYNVNDGSAAKFSEGYGPLNNMLFVCPQDSRYLEGLAITDDLLITAVPGIPELQIADSLKIYDKATMSSTPVGGFRINEGGVGFIYADKKGFVWMLQGKKILAINLTTGAIRPQSTINLPADVDAKTFSIDTDDCGEDRLLVANSGKDLNVLIYTNIYNAPTLSKTFGVKGGILVKSPKNGGGEYLQGEAGPMRFPGPTGVGVDDNGNIYISNMFVNMPNAILYSYNEATETMNWKQEGLAFTSTADFDEVQKNRVYNMDKIFDLDYDKKGGRMDTFIAATSDAFAFPSDMRLEPNPPSPIKTSAWKRKVNGTDYLFVSNMYSTILAGYRFDKEKYGYIAVPCVELRADGIHFWEDTNGDGQKDNNEITRYPASGNTFSTYPDHNGNIWMADNANQVVTGPAFRVWRVKGSTADNVLQYDAPKTYKLPSYITLANRVLYDAERDEMIVSCYTTANPTPNTAIWGQVGTTILTFKNMNQRFANIETVPSSEWKADQELIIPASASASLPDVAISAKAMTYAGDYLFTFLTADGKINIYERDGSNAYVGQLGPGDEVQRRSGWTDFTYALNARKNDDGTYELLAEENAFAKIIHYKVNSFDGNMTLSGDMTPERLWVQNGDKTNIDNINIPEGQPIKFTVRVRNIESGPVANMRRTDPGRCLVLFSVTDLKTGSVVYEAQSNVHEENIYGGDYVDMSVDNTQFPIWKYTKGKYRVDVDVNYGRKGKECSADNNYMSLEFGGGDNTGEITGPNAINNATVEKMTAVIAPNPVSSHFTISVKNTDEDEFAVSLITIDGRNVMTKRVQNNSMVDVSSLQPGYYILRVVTSDQTYSEKIIKK